MAMQATQSGDNAKRVDGFFKNAGDKIRNIPSSVKGFYKRHPKGIKNAAIGTGIGAGVVAIGFGVNYVINRMNETLLDQYSTSGYELSQGGIRYIAETNHRKFASSLAMPEGTLEKFVDGEKSNGELYRIQVGPDQVWLFTEYSGGAKYKLPKDGGPKLNIDAKTLDSTITSSLTNTQEKQWVKATGK